MLENATDLRSPPSEDSALYSFDCFESVFFNVARVSASKSSSVSVATSRVTSVASTALLNVARSTTVPWSRALTSVIVNASLVNFFASTHDVHTHFCGSGAFCTGLCSSSSSSSLDDDDEASRAFFSLALASVPFKPHNRLQAVIFGTSAHDLGRHVAYPSAALMLDAAQARVPILASPPSEIPRVK